MEVIHVHIIILLSRMRHFRNRALNLYSGPSYPSTVYKNENAFRNRNGKTNVLSSPKTCFPKFHFGKFPKYFHFGNVPKMNEYQDSTYVSTVHVLLPLWGIKQFEYYCILCTVSVLRSTSTITINNTQMIHGTRSIVPAKYYELYVYFCWLDKIICCCVIAQQTHKIIDNNNICCLVHNTISSS